MSQLSSRLFVLNRSVPGLRRSAVWLGWLVVIWIVVFYRLGDASLWDPDEGFYASASSEMLAARDWLAPRYNDAPFFDKPILFYLLQMAAFGLLGENEFAARIVPALSAIVLFGVTAWLGAQLFDRRTGALAALMLALLPATVALSAYAILDMTFVAFLFTGLSLIVVAALRGRPGLQYPGYVIVGLAVLTKGPLALVLAGLAFLATLIAAPAARQSLLGLRWAYGLCLALGVSAPWFLYMFWRFGYSFVESYFLRDNIWLYTRPLFTSTTSHLFFLRVTAIGLLPWTPLLCGRLLDVARGHRMDVEERVLWMWAAVVVAFFTFSQFRLDHYVYPAAPALCLLAAREWNRLGGTHVVARPWGAVVGATAVPLVVVAAGVALGALIYRVPLDLPPVVNLVPAAFVASGIVLLVQLFRRRFRTSFPLLLVAALLLAYALLLAFVLPQVERAKPVKQLAEQLAAMSNAADSVAAFRMDRWNSSWRFYLRRHVRRLETSEDLRAFFSEPGRRFCLLLRDDFENVVSEGIPLSVVSERPGLFVTSGRALRRDRRDAWRSFVVAVNAISP